MPTDERDAVPSTGVHDNLGGAVGDVVSALYGGDVGDLSGLGQLVDGDLRQDDRDDLSFVLQVLQFPDLVGQWHLGSMRCSWNRSRCSRPRRRRLISACCRRYSGRPTRGQAAGPSRFGPLSVSMTSGPLRVRPALVAIRMSSRLGVDGLVNDLFGDVGAVGVGGVDELDPQFYGTAHHGDAFVAVGGFAPDPAAGQSHRAETQSGHSFPGDLDGAGVGAVVSGVVIIVLLSGARRYLAAALVRIAAGQQRRAITPGI